MSNILEEADSLFPLLTKKFSFKSSVVNQDNFLPLRKANSFADSKEASPYSNFRSQSFNKHPSNENLDQSHSNIEVEYSFLKDSKDQEAVIVVDTFSTGAYLRLFIYFILIIYIYIYIYSILNIFALF